jgi:uncharacterized membrane protein (TIGR02234 family)
VSGTDSTDSTGRSRPIAARFARRGIVVMGIVLLALLAFGSSTQTWLTVRLPQESVQTPDLMIAGSDASTPVTAFALVALAAALAVSIAGRVARWVIAVILVLSGVGIVLSSVAVALDPTAAAEPAIGTAIGVSGRSGAEATASAMPWLAVVAGVLLVLAAVWLVLAGRRWGVNKRYDAGASRAVRPAPGDTQPGAPLPSTGDVAPGVVPEAAQGREGRGQGDGARGALGASSADGTAATGGSDTRSNGLPGDRQRANAHADEIDSWDELSRGNDPTR